MRKAIKQKKKEWYTDMDMKRYVGALAENFTKQVGGVAEQWLGVKKDTGEIKEILNTHTKILQRHELILSNHTETLDSHTEMIGKLMTDMTIIKEDIEFIKGGLKRKVDYDEFLALERRTAILETKTRVV